MSKSNYSCPTSNLMTYPEIHSAILAKHFLCPIQRILQMSLAKMYVTKGLTFFKVKLPTSDGAEVDLFRVVPADVGRGRNFVGRRFLVKAKDLLPFRKFDCKLFYVFCPSFFRQIFERAANLWEGHILLIYRKETSSLKYVIFKM